MHSIVKLVLYLHGKYVFLFLANIESKIDLVLLLVSLFVSSLNVIHIFANNYI